jgi:hypothetical protein
MECRGTPEELMVHPRRRGDIEFDSSGTPCPRKHAGKDVLTGAIQAMSPPPAAQVVFAETGDAKHERNHVERFRGHGV